MFVPLPSRYAEIAQLVEHDLAKVGVASSSLVFRSKIKAPATLGLLFLKGREQNPAICSREGLQESTSQE